MDLFLSVHLQKQCLLITLFINLLIHLKWTLLERFLRSLLRSLLIKSLTENILRRKTGLETRIENRPGGTVLKLVGTRSFKAINSIKNAQSFYDANFIRLLTKEPKEKTSKTLKKESSFTVGTFKLFFQKIYLNGCKLDHRLLASLIQ